MLENPWEALERRLLGAGQAHGAAPPGGPPAAVPGSGSPDPELEGRAAAEGAADRPWH